MRTPWLGLSLALALGVSAGGGVKAADLSGPTADPQAWQCAPFARMFSGIQLFGDAWTWWQQALGRYARGAAPKAGSVLVFKPFGPMRRGHVAVVDGVVDGRTIQVTHANWAPVEGRRGQVENAVTVVDVSPAGDWTQVKVWYRPSRALGTTIYPTYGFVYGAAEALGAARIVAATALDPASRAALSAEVEDAVR